MAEEKKEEIAFEIFGKRLEELKEMTENIGKVEKSNVKKYTAEESSKDKIKIREELKEKRQIIKPIEIQKERHCSKQVKAPVKTTSFINNLKQKINGSNTLGIKSSETGKVEERPIEALQKKKQLMVKIEHPVVRSFFGIHMGDASPKQKEIIREKIVTQRIPSAEKHEIFESLKRLDEKIDKNKEEIYKKLLRESAESKRMIEEEREQIKQQMIGLLAESIGKLDSKDREVKKELYGELDKIKNRFYGEKKEIRNLISNNSEESRKMLESEKEKIKEEFIAKIANLRKRINEEERKTKKREYENEIGNNSESGDNKLFSLFSRFRRLSPEKEIKPFSVENDNSKINSDRERLDEGDIITGMPEIPKSVDLGLPKFSPAKIFMSTSVNEFPENRQFSEIEEEAIDNEGYGIKELRTQQKFTRNIDLPGNYEKSIKNLLAPERVSKFDFEFERNMKNAVKRGTKDIEKKEIYKEKIITKNKTTGKTKPVYIEERDFEDAQQNIEQTKKTFHNFERVVGETTENSKREHAKLSRILEDALDISSKFSKINTGVLGKVRI